MRTLQKEKRRITLRTAVIVCSSLALAAFFLGKFASGNTQSESLENIADAYEEQRQNGKGVDQWKFTNPLLQCDGIESLSNKFITTLKHSVTDFLAKDEITNSATHVSVYFRDLNNGPWFGINEKENFLPGSLLKVPLMLTIFKKSEADPSFLDSQVTYEEGEPTAKQYFLPEKEVKKGETYTVRELVERMIRYSDNNAATLLSLLISKDELARSYEELGIISPTKVANTEYQMPVRTYASFFRILFNATYINRSFSELALQLLAQSTFDKGLRAGVPKEIKVAHKFGERATEDRSIAQLHDCGIIYYPEHPYLLCVMAQGKNFEGLEKIIAGISRTVYREMDIKYNDY